MTISAVTFIGSGGTLAGGGTPVISVTTAVPAGRLVFILIAKDNAASVDGTTSEILGIEDDVGGNIWQSTGAFCNSQDVSGDGIYVDLWYSLLTNGLSIGNALGVLKSTDVACAVVAYTATLSGAVIRRDPAVTLAGDFDLGSMSTSSLANVEHLHVRVIGVKDQTGVLVPTGGWTKTSEKSVGAVLSSTTLVAGEFKISTSTGETTDPDGFSAIIASVLVAFSEAALHQRTSAMAGAGGMTATGVKSRIRTTLYAGAGSMSSVRSGMTANRTTEYLGDADMFSLGVRNLVEAPPTIFEGIAGMATAAIVVPPWRPRCEGDPWLDTWGIWKDEGEWEDDDVWQDGPPVRHTRSLIMLQGTLRPASNLATWTERLELFDDETGQRYDLVEEVECITLTLRDIYTSEIVLRGDIDDGNIHVINPGIIEWSFSAETMQQLDPKHYDVGCLVEFRNETVQVMLGHVAVRRGL